MHGYAGPPAEDKFEDAALLMNAGRFSHLWDAVGSRDTARMEAILKDPQMDPNYKQRDYGGQTVLMRSAHMGDEDMVRLLCRHPGVQNSTGMGKVLINAGDDEGATALHYAAKARKAAVLRLLLASGGDVACSENDGCSLLHAAALGGCVECAHVLVEAGHPVNSVDQNGQTPLHHAAGGGHVEYIRYLHKAGAEPNHGDLDGLTPLMCAAAAGEMEAVQALVECLTTIGRDSLMQSDVNGSTALSWAKAHFHDAVVDFLERTLSPPESETVVIDREPPLSESIFTLPSST